MTAPPTERPDRDLVVAIRAELAGVDPLRACCRSAERAGLGAAAAGHAPSAAIARLAVRLDRDWPAGAGRDHDAPFDWAGAADHCRYSFLRGLFLARGSLSLATGRTHLEFVVGSDDAPDLAARLNGLGLPAATRSRRGAGVVTWKSTETVITFLRRVGASTTVLELEARLVSRMLRGQLNRAINAETANLLRQVIAGSRQLAAIEEAEAAGALVREPPPIRAVAAARRESPEATYAELAAQTGLTRSMVQRSLLRVESLAGQGSGVAAGAR